LAEARYDGPITINGAAYEVASLDSEWAMTLKTSVTGLQTGAPYVLRGIDIWRSTSGMEVHSSYSTTDGLKADGTPTTGSALIGAGDDLSARCAALPDLCKTSSGGGNVVPVRRPNGHWNSGAD
jgi:hypothetical protein